MTREQWLTYHVARAPKITPQQWAETLFLLRARRHGDHESSEEREAS
jgi:hypothetical protein